MTTSIHHKNLIIPEMQRKFYSFVITRAGILLTQGTDLKFSLKSVKFFTKRKKITHKNLQNVFFLKDLQMILVPFFEIFDRF